MHVRLHSPQPRFLITVNQHVRFLFGNCSNWIHVLIYMIQLTKHSNYIKYPNHNHKNKNKLLLLLLFPPNCNNSLTKKTKQNKRKSNHKIYKLVKQQWVIVWCTTQPICRYRARTFAELTLLCTRCIKSNIASSFAAILYHLVHFFKSLVFFNQRESRF